MDAVRVLLRRWYVVVAGVVLMAAAGGAVMKVVPTQYQASAQLILLLPSKATGARTPTNPYLNLQAGLVTTSSIISSSMMTPERQQKLEAEGHTAEYSVDVLPDSGPIVVVSAKSSDAAEAVDTRDAVIKEIDDQLTLMQSEVSVPKTQVIAPLEANVGPAQVLPGSKIRALAAVGAAGVVATLVVAFVVDGRRNRAVRRREKPAGPDEETGEPTRSENRGPAARDANDRGRPSGPRAASRPSAADKHSPRRRPGGKGRADDRRRGTGADALPRRAPREDDEVSWDPVMVRTPDTVDRSSDDARDS